MMMMMMMSFVSVTAVATSSRVCLTAAEDSYPPGGSVSVSCTCFLSSESLRPTGVALRLLAVGLSVRRRADPPDLRSVLLTKE